MAIETRTYLQLCKDIDTPRSLAMAILLSVATSRPNLTFGYSSATEEEQEKAWIEIMKFDFNPYTHSTLARTRANGTPNSFVEVWPCVVKSRNAAFIIRSLYQDQSNIDLVRKDYQATVFLQKWKGLCLKTIDPDVEARKSFWKSEKECCNTNARFAALTAQIDGPDGLPVFPSALCNHMQKVRKIFRGLLGPLPKMDELELRFGPGSVYEKSEAYRVNHLTVVDKLDATPHITSGGLSLFYELWKDTTWFREWYPRSVAFNQQLFTVGRSARYFSVHKKATMARGCGLEPGGNVCLQLAIARPMRRRLQKHAGLLVTPVEPDHYVGPSWRARGRERYAFNPAGTRLGLETPVLRREAGSERLHHQLAQKGSLSGADATVDFSRASDTVARLLVKFLASRDWYNLLDQGRTKLIEVDFGEDGKPFEAPGPTRNGKPLLTGEVRSIYMEKFSSMGNGFTFELETLVFYSLARSVCEEWETVSVYGDDVILPADKAKDFIALAQFCGFTTNTAKTYVSGPFRESCGGDFLHGENIRPYFQKEEINETRHTFSLANGLYRASAGAASQDSGYLNRSWKLVLSNIPSAERWMRGPEILGDAVIHDLQFAKYALAPKGWKRDRIWRNDGITYIVTKKPATLKPFREGHDCQRFFAGLKFTVAKRQLKRYDDSTRFLAALYGVDSEGIAPRGEYISTTHTYYEVG